MPKIGFIGAGKMAEAIMAGLLTGGQLSEKEIIYFEPDQDRAGFISQEYGFSAQPDTKTLLQVADVVVISVKPGKVPEILSEIKSDISASYEKKMFISIAAGVTIAQLEAGTDFNLKWVRVMPNTPALIKEGMCVLSFSPKCRELEKNIAISVFGSVGKTIIVDESLMDAVTGFSGSGPAYVYLFLEAMIAGGVCEGFSSKQAREMAVQTLKGAAAMVAEFPEKHIAELRDDVTSPGGTTSAALKVLEEEAVRAAVIKSIHAATEKSKSMGKKGENS